VAEDLAVRGYEVNLELLRQRYVLAIIGGTGGDGHELKDPFSGEGILVRTEQPLR
jgi:hypothetical protein